MIGSALDLDSLESGEDSSSLAAPNLDSATPNNHLVASNAGSQVGLLKLSAVWSITTYVVLLAYPNLFLFLMA